MKALRRNLLGALLAICALPVLAHKPSDAYLRLQPGPTLGAAQGQRLEQRLDIAVRDLDRELDLDADGDGRITWGELRARWPDIEALAAAGVQISAGDQRCSVSSRAAPQIDEHSDGSYAVVVHTLGCAPSTTPLALRYSLFATSDPTHRGIVLVAGTPGGDRPHVLGPDLPTLALGFEAVGAPLTPGLTRWLDFVREGVHHILIGTDHVLFLLALLLPAVLVRAAGSAGRSGSADQLWSRSPLQEPWSSPRRLASTGALAQQDWIPACAGVTRGEPNAASALETHGGIAIAAAAIDWHPAPTFRPMLAKVLAVVTAFTLAHSITLALAALGVLDPPTRWVESLIAASVAFAAIDNLWPMLPRQRAALAFGFGLVHGFGFASVLKDVGLERGHLILPLLSFNLGVEIGQLMIVSLFLPLAWALRRTAFYRHAVLPIGSLVILTMALLWLAERALDIALLPGA